MAKDGNTKQKRKTTQLPTRKTDQRFVYKIKELSPPREGKKLLVLDLDHTLVDPSASRRRMQRPYLHEFLALVYENYDIVIWSASRMSRISDVVRHVGMTKNRHYKILFLLDKDAMIREDGSRVRGKPLNLIWDRYEQYSSANTVFIDDKVNNFRFNPTCGIKMKRYSSDRREKDYELLKLLTYLLDINDSEDFNLLDHRMWTSKILETIS